MLQSVITLIAVVVGAAAAAGGAYLGQRALGERTRRENWADHSASALADVKMLLTDANPESLLSDKDPHAEYVDDAAGRRVSSTVRVVRDVERAARVRREVAVLASGHPSAQIREESSKLEVYVAMLMDADGRLLDELVEDGEASEETKRDALDAWREAHAVRHRITESLHSSTPPV